MRCNLFALRYNPGCKKDFRCYPCCGIRVEKLRMLRIVDNMLFRICNSEALSQGLRPSFNTTIQIYVSTCNELQILRRIKNPKI
jgi:hypothetical protein